MAFRDSNQATAEPFAERRGPLFNRAGGVVPLGLAAPADPWMNIAGGARSATPADPATLAATISAADFRCDGPWVEHTAFPRVRVRYAAIDPADAGCGFYAAQVHWLNDPVANGSPLPSALVARISELAWQAFGRHRLHAAPAAR